MVTTGQEHWHDTSIWQNADKPRVTYAFDIVNAQHWNRRQVFLPFDSDAYGRGPPRVARE